MTIMEVDRKQLNKDLSNQINQIIKEKNIRTIYYDSDRIIFHVQNGNISVCKEEDWLSVMLKEKEDVLYLVSKQRNKQGLELAKGKEL